VASGAVAVAAGAAAGAAAVWVSTAAIVDKPQSAKDASITSFFTAKAS
jgi:hypothetical protein